MAAIEAAVAEYDPINASGTAEEFQALANGFFQAEGFVGILFRDLIGLSLFPLMSINQLYTPESLAFFVRLHYALDCVGVFSVVVNDSGNLMIVYRLKGWTAFFNTFVPYFTMLFGLKYTALLRMARIHQLVNAITLNNNTLLLNDLQYELVSLVYSLTSLTSSRRLYSMEEKLLANAINPTASSNLNMFENTYTPTFVWILGFFLGDGSLFLSLKWLSKEELIHFIPVFALVQKVTTYNLHFMTLMMEFIKSLGVNCNIYTGSTAYDLLDESYKTPMYKLIVEGQLGVILGIIPLLTQYHHFLYWKLPQYHTMLWFIRLVETGSHLCYLGILYVIDYIRPKDIAKWYERLEL